jgi:hypothetical protein
MDCGKDPNLERAEAELVEAEAELRSAEGDLSRAIAEQKRAAEEIGRATEKLEKAQREIERLRPFGVAVIYDGQKRPFEVRFEEIVKKLLDQAIAAFGPLPNPHRLSLYLGTVKLNDSATIKAAGVKPCDTLLLRPSTVKGGA